MRNNKEKIENIKWLYINQDKQIIELLQELCPDFRQYKFLENDIGRGTLLGIFEVFWKSGDDFWEYKENKKRGLIIPSDQANKDLHLDIFKKNFVSVNATDNPEEGWCEEPLLELLRYIKRNYTLLEYCNV